MELAINPNSIEARMLRIFRSHLGNEGATLEDDFFDLGGDSFLAMEVVADVDRELSFKLELAVLIESPSIGAVVVHVERGLVSTGTTATQ